MTERGAPKVLHLLACDNWGGTEVQVTTQVLGWDPAHGEQCVAILAPAGVVHERLRSARVKAWSLAGAGGRAGAVVRLARILRHQRIDLVEAYGFTAGLVARAAIVVSGNRARLILGIRGLHFTEAEDPNGPKTRLVLAVERALAPTVARYDANSCGARDFLVERGFPQERFTVIINGVAAEGVPTAAPSSRGKRPLVVCVSRFVPRKRHDVLLRALALVRDLGDDFSCDLVGYGPTLEEARELSRELGLDDHVQFSGAMRQPDVTRRLAEADLFVQTSLWEGMPGSVLEAMAAALPVVGSDVNGTREVVVHEVTGLLVPAADIAATADAIRALLRNPDKRHRMGQAARERIERAHSFENVRRQKAALYEMLVG